MSEQSILQVERAVVAGVLLDSSQMRAAVAECGPVDFLDKRLGDIFRGMAGMFARREPIDAITVSGRLLDWGVRGIEFADLIAWTSDVPHAAATAHYAEQVRRAALARGRTSSPRASVTG